MPYDLILLFITFFKIGLFTIGGGYAMIPLIRQEVTSKGFITISELADFIGVAESTPGPFAINLATFIGTKTAGILGAISCTVGVVLPSFIIILIITKFFMKFKDNRFVKAGLLGLRPVIVALVASAVIMLIRNNLFWNDVVINSLSSFLSAINIKAVIIFVIAFLVQLKFKLHPIFLILISAVLGILLFGFVPDIRF
ncbi:MAG: chromate transporter [Oscillospiraceae bacterium]|nr:chromate transporter [Oscillospiraceae bacterium]